MPATWAYGTALFDAGAATGSEFKAGFRTGFHLAPVQSEFQMHTAAVITVSDSCARGERVDLSGPAVGELLAAHGFSVVHTLTVQDEQVLIEDALRSAAGKAMLVITTGGTGITARDVTPEATAAVCQRLVPGVPELMRAQGQGDTILAVLSRSLCGLLGNTLVLNLPGSPRGAMASLRAAMPVLPHALALLEDSRAPHPPNDPVKTK